ncbi:hypothetical protein [Ornithinimicrobium cerasi]|uniref:Uncharacterized protein n=1 Tax=Ornithinimicrobium cerasi TaxID=2248773 RepID=A0A285VIC6_9MICO|nr:hypothetical protein [Ornithinimicrobium cerasi]SOC52301.1 hypothetical protein SAMN05421879_101481 [Ornithinimicrobium cerasi]
MDADDPDGPGAGRRQRLAAGLTVGMLIGVGLSLALDDWGMLVVGLALCIVFWAGSGSDAR